MDAADVTPNPAPRTRLVAGLGNPGKKYEQTPHNVGFDVLDRLTARKGVELTDRREWKGWLGRIGSTWLLKPATFMNLSGESVAAVSRFYKIKPEEILVVYDDAALEPGQLRFKASGSPGGHNGLQSIVNHLGTRDVPRLRIGIGQGRGEKDLVGHVLGKFSPAEREIVDIAVVTAAEAIDVVIEKGIDAAMNIYNKKQQV